MTMTPRLFSRLAWLAVAVIIAATTLLATTAGSDAIAAAPAAHPAHDRGDQITRATRFVVPKPTYKTVSEDLFVRMSDGVRLGATVTYPSRDGVRRAPGRFPVVLSITPYGRAGLCSCPDAALFATRGMVSAVVDTRGTGGSEGNLNQNYFSPLEARDGYQLVEHFGTRSWSNGKVGMAGGSYVGITQYLTAEQQPPHLAAIVPGVALSDLYRDAFTHDGVPNLFFDAQYIAVQGGPGAVTPPPPSQVAATPEVKLQQLLGTPIALDYLKRPNDGRFYRARSPYYRASKIKVPVLILDGWRDGFVRGAVEMYRALARRPGVETRMYVDPCTHKGCGAPFAATLSDAGGDDVTAMTVEFLAHHLLGTSTPRRAAVRSYVQNASGQILESTQWPPRDTDFVEMRLRGTSLTPGAPRGRETTRAYVTNPLEGITNPLDFHGTVAISPYVPLDQQLASATGLTWRSAPLKRSAVLAGPSQLHLVASSSSTDTDWIVQVTDVAPDGSVALVTQGYLRASHRAIAHGRSSLGSPYHRHDRAVPIKPGRFYSYEVAIWPTTYRVPRGHRIGVRLSTYDVPTHAPASIQLDPTAPGIEVVTPSRNTVRMGRGGTSLLLPWFRESR